MRSGNRDSRALPIPVQEYMGAWEWYDRQVELSQATTRNKNKLVDRRGAAIPCVGQDAGLASGYWNTWEVNQRYRESGFGKGRG
jgi:hypothetical protein